LKEAIVVSMGTGTAIVYAKADGTHKYLGGTGVGGGTMMGLSKKFLGVSSVHNFSELAAEGDISKIDLRVCDITKNDIHPDLPSTLTAANFGKVSDLATNSDIALGILNMIFETIAMLAIFAARSYNIKDIVLTGNLTNISKCEEIFQSLNEHFGVNFIIPQNARYATVIGAALSNFN
jgi:type II pantothenate kinase